MNTDDLEDYLEIQNSEVAEQIRQGYAYYQRGECRDALAFLAELKQEKNSG